MPFGQRLKSVCGEELRIDRNFAFCAAERYVDDGALERNRTRQGAEVVKIDIRVKPQPAFEWPATGVVLSVLTLKHRKTPILSADR